jgi:ABC-type histidine transport system ATPase subunit
MEGSTAAAVVPALVVDPAHLRERQALGMAIIEVDGLVGRYGDHTVVNGVGFTGEQGEIFGCGTGSSPAIPRCLSRFQSAPVESTRCVAL